MKKDLTNYAFIDSQNINLGVQDLGWKLDWRRFRVHLAETYSVERAYIFIGYIQSNQQLYNFLEKYGYTLIFKTVERSPDGKIKGNVDAELVLQAMIDYAAYEQAVIVTSDGDFACLVNHLRENSKLRAVISPNLDRCSKLLKRAAQGKVDILANLKSKLEYRKSKTRR